MSGELDPIRIEKYSTIENDGVDLWEITDLTLDDLAELDEHLTLSPVKLSDDLADFHRELKRLLSSVDMRRAS